MDKLVDAKRGAVLAAVHELSSKGVPFRLLLHTSSHSCSWTHSLQNSPLTSCVTLESEDGRSPFSSSARLAYFEKLQKQASSPAAHRSQKHSPKMGGFSSATVVASTSFLMGEQLLSPSTAGIGLTDTRLASHFPETGTLAMHWTADHLLLWQTPVTRQSLLTAHEYYRSTFGDSSSKFQSIIIAIGAIGAGTTISKALGGRESNWLFDGASLCGCQSL